MRNTLTHLVPFSTHPYITLSSSGNFRQQTEAGRPKFCTDKLPLLSLTSHSLKVLSGTSFSP